jgi:transcription elongation factor Elf1
MNDRDENLIEFVKNDTPRLHQPTCPACNHDPLEFMCNVVSTPVGHLVSVIWCVNCGHTMSTQFIGMDQPQQPKIIRPS